MLTISLCIGLCVIIWIANGIWIWQAVKGQVTSEIFIHTAVGVFFTSLALELTIGQTDAWLHLGVGWLKVAGWILFIPSVILIFGSMMELSRKGKPTAYDPTDATTFVDTGIFHIIRQPITLGISIWSIALMMVFQSLPSLAGAVLVISCCWISARMESAYDIKKFGEKYEKYIQSVPMWNIFRGLQKDK